MELGPWRSFGCVMWWHLLICCLEIENGSQKSFGGNLGVWWAIQDQAKPRQTLSNRICSETAFSESRSVAACRGVEKWTEWILDSSCKSNMATWWNAWLCHADGDVAWWLCQASGSLAGPYWYLCEMVLAINDREQEAFAVYRVLIYFLYPQHFSQEINRNSRTLSLYQFQRFGGVSLTYKHTWWWWVVMFALLKLLLCWLSLHNQWNPPLPRLKFISFFVQLHLNCCDCLLHWYQPPHSTKKELALSRKVLFLGSFLAFSFNW